MAATAEKPPSLEGTIIRNRWRLETTLGKGSFGEVYLAFDSETNSRVAVKIEFPTVKKAVLKLEIAILKRLSFCKHICTFIAGGRFIAPHLLSKGQDPNDFVHTYLVMSLLGSSISDLRKKRQNGSFSIPTTCLLGMQMLTSMQAVHSTGVLHRDIKPGNFCVARECVDGKPRPLCHLIDFGLSRRYLNSSGSIREERTNVGFRGTARYASIAAHCGKELGRVDDLWSLFYMTVEFLEGTLPWKGKEKDKIGDYKQKHTKEKLVRNLPVQMTYYLHYLQGLEYESAPDYDYIRTLYQEMFTASGASENISYDWDIPNSAAQVESMEEMSVSLPACGPTATNPDQSFTPMMVDPCDDLSPPLQLGAATAAEPENGSMNRAHGTVTLQKNLFGQLKKKPAFMYKTASGSLSSADAKMDKDLPSSLEPRPSTSAPDSSPFKFSFTRSAGKRLTRSFSLLKN